MGESFRARKMSVRCVKDRQARRRDGNGLVRLKPRAACRTPFAVRRHPVAKLALRPDESALGCLCRTVVVPATFDHDSNALSLFCPTYAAVVRQARARTLCGSGKTDPYRRYRATWSCDETLRWTGE